MKKIQKILMISIGIIIVLIILGFFLTEPDKKPVDELTYDTYYVDNAHDDARTFAVDLSEVGYGNEDGAWATLQLSPSYSFGVKFNNITIPKNAIIDEAFVELYSIGTPNHTNPNCKIYCDNVDNALPFNDTLGVLNRSGRIYTQNYTRWNKTIESGNWIITPLITDVIQEIVNRENWTSGNSIAVLFVSEGQFGYVATFENFEHNYPTGLYISWKEST